VNETPKADSMFGFTASALDFASEESIPSNVNTRTEKFCEKPSETATASSKLASSFRFASSGKCISEVSFEDNTVETLTAEVVQFTLMFTISINLGMETVPDDSGKPMIRKLAIVKKAISNAFFARKFSPRLNISACSA